MDCEFWLRLGKLGLHFLKILRKLVIFRIYADNKTLRARVKIHEQINDVMKTLFSRVPDRWIFNLAHYRAAEKINRALDEKIFCRMLAWESIRNFTRWGTWPKYCSLKSIIQWI